jgi:hypothetical protein
MELIFDVALLDEDGISEVDAENLYLLTSRAMATGDTEREFHEVACTSPNRIYSALFSERVLKAVRKELVDKYEEEHGTKANVQDEAVESCLREMLSPLEI